MTKNKNKKSSEAAKQEAFKLSDGICYCKTPEELIPEASHGSHSNLGTLGFAAGFVIMMILDVALG